VFNFEVCASDKPIQHPVRCPSTELLTRTVEHLGSDVVRHDYVWKVTVINVAKDTLASLVHLRLCGRAFTVKTL